jgi:hypothetical protein
MEYGLVCQNGQWQYIFPPGKWFTRCSSFKDFKGPNNNLIFQTVYIPVYI